MRRGIGLFLVTLVLSGYAFTFDDGDFQYWNTESISWKLDKEYKATFETEFRYGDNASNFYYQHSDIGVAYSGLAKWVDLGLNYRQIFEEKSSIWRYENVPHFNATFKWKWFGIDFSDRSRLEYKNKEEAEDYWRYREKFTVTFPLKLTKLNIQPYIANETFYDFNVESLNKNRLFGGFNFKLVKNLKAEVYYFWESSKKNDKWSDLHILGTKLKLSF